MNNLSQISKLSFMVCAGLACANTAFAQETSQKQSQSPSEKVHGFVSLMVGSAPEYEGSADNRIVPFGSLYLQNGNYYLQTEGLGAVANIWNSDSGLILGPAINYRPPRKADYIDNAIVSLLTEVDGALEIGGFIGYSTNIASEWDEFEVRVKGLADVGDAHGGYTIEGSISYSTPLSRKLLVGASASVSYVDDKYNQTYFGVNATDAALSGLNLYSAESGFKDITATVHANYNLYGNWGLFGVASYSRLLNDAKDSPLVEGVGGVGDANGLFTAIGISYRF